MRDDQMVDVETGLCYYGKLYVCVCRAEEWRIELLRSGWLRIQEDVGVVVVVVQMDLRREWRNEKAAARLRLFG
jgi:hypothetical protein